MDLVYCELRGMASREMRREHGEYTLRATPKGEWPLALQGRPDRDWKE
jgi:hypothetical protein